MCFLNIDSCTDHCFCLHLCDFRISYRKTAAAMAHHGIEFMQRVNQSLDFFYRLILSLSQFFNVFFIGRNELMKRRIQETDCNRASF